MCVLCTSSTALVSYVVFTVAKALTRSVSLKDGDNLNTLPLQTHIRGLLKAPVVFKIDVQKVLGCKAELTTLWKCLRASTVSLCVTLLVWAYEHGRQQGRRFFSIPHRIQNRRCPASDVCGDQT